MEYKQHGRGVGTPGLRVVVMGGEGREWRRDPEWQINKNQVYMEIPQ